MSATPNFEVRLDDELPEGSRLLVALAGPGMAGFAAGDYLVSNLETTQVGAVVARDVATVTPFTDGEPRHPIRLYSAPADGVAVLLSEVFFPAGVGPAFADALVGGVDAVEDVTVLHGVPYPHGPDEHAVFRVTTEGYPTDRLDSQGVDPLSGGFFDGAVGSLVSRGIDGEGPPVGVLVTPSHPPGPDFDSALLLLEAATGQFGLTVDESELRERSEAVRRHFEELAERIQATTEEEAGADYPIDRMYM